MNSRSSLSVVSFAALVVLGLFGAGCNDAAPVDPSTVMTEAPALAKRNPSVPAALAVPAGNRVSEHYYARGVQIYQCVQTTDGYTWSFVAPEATLYANECYRGVQGTHYAGPTWESNSGSMVVGSVLARSDSPDPNAVPWLLLQAVSTSGHGVFEGTTYIQRVNTVGGKAPATGADAEHLGQVVRIPYTAEYYFYRSSH